ncbi:MAG TPA: hypothetical protein PLV50_10405 [Smithella sp.]|nr:hypothetical protein [Smithella sp.]HNY49932.1 hypothetical protein [Smithella sp.]HOG90941.1 hypothetical protein [Smithella sp.]HOU50621.1 hypothetical protein [Smithella sp.]HQG64766.1 hypothetical protein [Smithella sp.]
MMKRKLWLILGLVLIVAFTLTACSSSDDDDESSAKAITAYSIAGSTGVINETAKTIAVNVPFGTNVTSMVATFTTTGEKVEVGSTRQVSGTTANNFSSPVIYKVTAENGSSVTYTVTVTVAPSSAKEITAFSIGSYAGTINPTAKTIAVNVLWGKDLSALVATFSTTGSNVKVGSMVQVSGDTANNFSTPVVYTVTAADASTQDYTVTVTANLGGSWTQKKDFGGVARSEAVAFGILNGKGYMGTGWNGTTYYSDFWEYDAAANTWTQVANFGSTPNNEDGLIRKSAVAFAIGTKGYVGTGYDGTNYYNDFWEYDPASNVWTQLPNVGATAAAATGVAGRADAVGFSIMTSASAGKGYAGTGFDGTNYYKDFYEFDPATGFWTKKTDFPGTARTEAVGLSISTKGYVGTGRSGTALAQYHQDFYEFNPAANTWTRKADFAGGVRAEAVALYCQCSNGYVGLGTIPCYDPCGEDCPCGKVCYAFSDFWEYNATTDQWIQKAYYDGGELTGARTEAAAFSLNSVSHFVGTGWGCSGTQTSTSMTPSGFYKDFWKYTP